MAGIDDSASSPRVLSDTHLTICLHCGYSLRGLPEGHNCPECGHPSDREAARQEVLDVINQPMLKLGWRMLQFWRPLPVGWWWTMDRRQDRLLAKRKVKMWWISALTLMAAMLYAIMAYMPLQVIVTYQHPPGKPELREQLYVEGVDVSFEMIQMPPNTGWVTYSENVYHTQIDPEFGVLSVTMLLILAGLTTYLPRLWIRVLLNRGRKRALVLDQGAVLTASMYQAAPLVLLGTAEIGLGFAFWLCIKMGSTMPGYSGFLDVIICCHVFLAGFTWLSSILSDKRRFLFSNRSVALAGFIFASGPVPVLLAWLIGMAVGVVFGY